MFVLYKIKVILQVWQNSSLITLGEKVYLVKLLMSYLYISINNDSIQPLKAS